MTEVESRFSQGDWDVGYNRYIRLSDLDHPWVGPGELHKLFNISNNTSLFITLGQQRFAWMDGEYVLPIFKAIKTLKKVTPADLQEFVNNQ